MKYDRNHPIWEQACVAAMATLALREATTRFEMDASDAVYCANCLIAEMNKALETTNTTTEKP